MCIMERERGEESLQIYIMSSLPKRIRPFFCSARREYRFCSRKTVRDSVHAADKASSIVFACALLVPFPLCWSLNLRCGICHGFGLGFGSFFFEGE